MNSVRVGLLGLGTVGQGTVRVLSDNASEIARRAGRHIEVVSAAVRDVEKAKSQGFDIDIHADPQAIVDDPSIAIVCELMGGTELSLELVLRAIDNGKHVVTANKALIAIHGNEIFAAAQKKGVTVAFEPAVAGGIPVIKAIREGLAGNDIQWLVLFSLSLGMGAPLMLIGASAGKLLPRAGGWMDAVKSVFGVLMIGMAIWMLERVLPASVILALTAMLLIVSSVYMGALNKPAEGKSGWYQLWRGLGVVFLLYGAILMVGAASGSKSLLKPLGNIGSSSVAGGTSTASDELHFTRVNSNAELDAAIASANAQGKSVMYDFYADWCTSCKEMEAFTFTDPQVQAALSNFVTLQVDVTDNNEEHQAMLKRYGLFGPPAILFYGPSGEEQRNLRVVGFMEADAFAANVRAVQ